MIKTNSHYWDCECEKGYVKPKTVATCAVCGACADNQPDSIENEHACKIAVLIDAFKEVLKNYKELYQEFDPDGDIACHGEFVLDAEKAIEQLERKTKNEIQT